VWILAFLGSFAATQTPFYLCAFASLREIFCSLRSRRKLLFVFPRFAFAVGFLIWPTVGLAEPPGGISQGTPPPGLKSQIVRPVGEHATGTDLVESVRQLLANVRETSYRHQLQVDPAKGIYELDCSEFVSLILERVAPKHYQEIPTEPGHSQPRARMYFRFFEELKRDPRTGWQPITNLADVAPGDVVAWEKLNNGGLGDTGHVMIVAEPAHLDQDGTFQVRVYDSSEISHAEDSRPAGSSGIGSGSVLFRVNENGAPIAFQFNLRSHWHYEPIAIGRLEPM
jgi:hypothetical protein